MAVTCPLPTIIFFEKPSHDLTSTNLGPVGEAAQLPEEPIRYGKPFIVEAIFFIEMMISRAWHAVCPICFCEVNNVGRDFVSPEQSAQKMIKGEHNFQ